MIALTLAVRQLLDTFRPATDEFWLETMAYWFEGGIDSLSSQYVNVQINFTVPASGNTINPASDAAQTAAEISLPRE